MNPIGSVEDDGRTLVLTRRFRAAIEDVWASITESDRLARWYGTWTGDPATGTVMVTMNAEAEPVAPLAYTITTCEPPRRLAIEAADSFGRWQLSAELREAAGTTTLVFRQHDLDPTVVADVGPGWDWYLDRLAATIDGTTVPSLADFEATYAPLGTAYGELRG
jgi:uncharacterized protein YndB with AHSA1/START domain